MKKSIIWRYVVILCAGVWCSEASAQGLTADTLKLSLPQAEKLFLEHNISLLLKKYDIQQAQAEVITARLFPNPEITYNNLFYNHETHRFFETSMETGQYSAEISQLFSIAGKRNKNVKLAQKGAEMAQYEFYDLLRTLRFSLRSSFYKIYYQQQSARVYGLEITSLKKTLTAFEQQLAKGNIAVKEVLRIKSLLYTLESEYSQLQDDIDDTQTELKTLIRADARAYIIPETTVNLEGKSVLARANYQVLLDTAYANRADMKLAKAGMEYAGLNLRLQRANAVPDINLSLSYDLKGSYPDKHTGIGISLPIPVFNRNQGAIKQAKIGVESSKLTFEQQQQQLQQELANSFAGAVRVEKLYNSFDARFSSDFEQLIKEVDKNYQKRNISLLEFLDFYDAYKENTLKLNGLRLNRISSIEELNYVVGTQVFNP